MFDIECLFIGMNRLYTEYLKYKFQVRRRYRRWKSGRKRRDSINIGEVIIAGGEDEVHIKMYSLYSNVVCVVGCRISMDTFREYTICRSTIYAHLYDITHLHNISIVSNCDARRMDII